MAKEERNQQIIIARHAGNTFQTIAQQHNVGRETVRRIFRRYERRQKMNEQTGEKNNAS